MVLSESTGFKSAFSDGYVPNFKKTTENRMFELRVTFDRRRFELKVGSLPLTPSPFGVQFQTSGQIDKMK